MPYRMPSNSSKEAVADRRSFVPRFTAPAVFSLFAGLATMLAPSSVSAQGALSDGDGVVTVFSGLDRAPDGTPRPDRNGAVLRGLGLASPGFPANGSLWEDPQFLFSLTARDIGQVFAVAFDGEEPANVYVAATSAFGLYRTRTGDDWAPGMWGSDGGPGTIWKLNGERGYRPEKFADVTYVDTPNQGAGIGDLAFDPWHNQLLVSDLESGLIHRYDLGGELLESFDHGVDGRSFFVDAETGEDARLDAVQHDPDSAPNFEDCPSAFDSTPDCWNYADFRRRIWGLGVFDDPESGSVRLYYAVWGGAALGSEGWEAAGDDAATTIWSVAIADGGWFDPTDVRREIALPGLTEDSEGSAPVTDIAFTREGTMIAAERGRPGPDFESDEFPALVRPDDARVLRLVQGGGGRWRVDGRYDAGFPSGGEADIRANAGGAVSLGHGFEEDGTPEPDRPDGTIWMSVITLCSRDEQCVGRESGERDESGPAAGLQGIPSDLQEDLDLEGGAPSGPLASYLVRLRGAGQVAGDVGGVAIYRSEIPTQIVARPARRESPDEEPEVVREPAAEDVVEEIEALEPARLTADLALSMDGGSECEPGTACAVELSITNESDEDYRGPIVLSVRAEGPGASVSTASPGAWVCADSGGQLLCRLESAEIEADGAETLTLAVQPGTGHRQPTLQSCAALTWLGLAGRERIRAVQVELGRRGFSAGTADGILGPRTTSAIEQAQSSLDVPRTGDISGELIAAMFGEGAYLSGDADDGNDADCAVVNVDVPPAPAHRESASRQDGRTIGRSPGRHNVQISQFHARRSSAQHNPATSAATPMHQQAMSSFHMEFRSAYHDGNRTRYVDAHHPVMSRFHRRFDSSAHNPETSGIEQYHSIRRSGFHDIGRSRAHDGFTSRGPRMHNPYTSGAW